MERREDYLADLNPQQYEAATHIDGPMLIVAGAGSGKTKTLVSRTIHLIESGIPPQNILLVTFTNKAAAEMKSRIIKACGEDGNKVTACTFHSFCAARLRGYSDITGYSPDFTIIDTGDTRDILTRLLAEKKKEMQKDGTVIDDKKFPQAGKIAAICSDAVNSRISVTEASDKAGVPDIYTDAVENIIDRYQIYKLERNSMDFDDMLLVFVELLQGSEMVRKDIQSRYRYIMADEYQDTNYLQDELLRLLAGEEKNLVVVGDDNQSIYAFRGAKIENILNFESNYEGCKKVVLFENYRSSEQIATFFNAVMSHAKEGIRKDLHGQFEGERPQMLVFDDRWAQARYIVDQIQEKHRSGLPLREVGVIARNSNQTAAIESELGKRGVPFEKFGGPKFWDKESVRNILSFLRVAAMEKDEIAWYRVLKVYPRIGHSYANSIAEGIVKYGMHEELNNPHHFRYSYMSSITEIYDTITKLKTMDLHQQLDFLLNGYYENLVRKMIKASRMSPETKQRELEQLDNDMMELPILFDLAKDYTSARKFLDDMTLSFANPNDENDKVNITTIHSAKGLEYDTVFVIDPIDGLFPRSRDDCPEDREELRCLYVALTRAKKDLQVCLVAEYMKWGDVIESELSHFLAYPDVIGACDADPEVYHMFPKRRD